MRVVSRQKSEYLHPNAQCNTKAVRVSSNSSGTCAVRIIRSSSAVQNIGALNCTLNTRLRFVLPILANGVRSISSVSSNSEKKAESTRIIAVTVLRPLFFFGILFAGSSAYTFGYLLTCKYSFAINSRSRSNFSPSKAAVRIPCKLSTAKKRCNTLPTYAHTFAVLGACTPSRIVSRCHSANRVSMSAAPLGVPFFARSIYRANTALFLGASSAHICSYAVRIVSISPAISSANCLLYIRVPRLGLPSASNLESSDNSARIALRCVISTALPSRKRKRKIIAPSLFVVRFKIVIGGF